MNAAGWSDDQWAAAIASPQWAPKVLEALEKLFAEHFIWLSPVTLVEARLDADLDGTPVLLVIYDHASWPERTGLRRRLGLRPTSLSREMTPEESLAVEIAMSDIGEPLGTYHESLVPDSEGVWWWGDGYGVGESWRP
jgi:hypothetical protein